MTDSSFSRWRQAQQAVAEAEHRLAMAMHPSSAALVGASLEQLRGALEAVRQQADQALAECLRETERLKRTSRSLGMSTSGSSQ
jgi:hypothetical protein